MVQVKGVMPPEGGKARETPTGRAVGGFGVWHNFWLGVGKSYVIFCIMANVWERKNKIVMP